MSTSKNRERFPITAKLIDELREHFPNAQVTYCKEGLNETGNRDTRHGVRLSDMYPGRLWEIPVAVDKRSRISTTGSGRSNKPRVRRVVNKYKDSSGGEGDYSAQSEEMGRF